MKTGGVGRVFVLATLLIGLMGTVSADRVGYYDFEGDLENNAGNYNDGNNNGGAFVSGWDGQGLEFDKSQAPDYAEFGRYHPYIDDSFTVGIWYKAKSTDSSSYRLVNYHTGQSTGAKEEANIDLKNNGYYGFYTQDDSGNGQYLNPQTSDNSWNTGEWTHVMIRYTDSDVKSIWVNGSKVSTTQTSSTPFDWNINDGWIGIGGKYNNDGTVGGKLDAYVDEFVLFNESLSSSEIQNVMDCSSKVCNQKPQFDSFSTNPSSWTFNSDIDVSANVSDDGTVSSVSADVWEDGSQIVSDASLSDSDGDGAWEIDNLFSVDESDVYYNLTLTATDDYGATATYETSQFIQDLPPAVTIQSPGNSTYWSYDVPYQVDVDNNNDNLPGQSFSCDFSSNGTVFRSVSGSGVDSFSGNFSQDLGQGIEFKASCSDTGGTTNETLSFTVEDFEVQSVYSDSPVYETENRTFESEIYQGEMVESVDFSLIWDGETVNNASQSLDAEGSMIQDLEHTIPLVSSNNTQKFWKWNFTVERTEINGNTSSVTYSSSDQGQDVFWSYWISDSTALYDQESSSQVKILEGQDAGQRLNVSRETSSASLSGKMNFTRTDAYLDMDKEEISDSLVQFEASELSDKISSSSRTDDVFSNITVSFQGDSRKISTTDTVETHQIQFSQGAGTDALQFEVLQENDFSNTLSSDMDVAVEYWAENSSQRVTRTFSTASESKSTHTFEISPSWAELVVDSSEKLIQYQDSNENYRLRSYFLLEETVSSDVTEIDLYALKKDVSSRIGIETVDSDGSTIPEVIVRAERYFPAEDKAISVAMARTGSDGRTESFFEVNEIYYGFKFYEKDESGSYQLVSEEPQQIISQDLLRFTISDVEQIGYYDFKDGIGSSCEFNATQVRCSYTSEEAVQEVVLNVEEERPISWENVCSRQASTASATLICNGLNATDKAFRYSLEATSGDGDTITLETGRSGQGSGGFGDAGLIISFFLFVTLGLGSVAGPRPIPEISVLLSTVAVVASYSVGLLAITYQAAATFVILGAITIYKMRRDTGGGVGL